MVPTAYGLEKHARIFFSISVKNLNNTRFKRKTQGSYDRSSVCVQDLPVAVKRKDMARASHTAAVRCALKNNQYDTYSY